jgi:F-type H+-transporting ATPase subunit b
LITKTGTAILGSGLLATAISQELYMFNDSEETVIAVGYFMLRADDSFVQQLFLGKLPLELRRMSLTLSPERCLMYKES